VDEMFIASKSKIEVERLKHRCAKNLR